MENSSVLDTNDNGNLFKEEKPKGKLNKKILIICSLITILIIIGVVFFIISTKYSRMVEKYINTELSNIAQDYDNFNFHPFKCSGYKEITCNSDFIEFYDDYKFLVKNVSFTGSPSVNGLKAGVSSNIEISAVDTENNTESNVIKFNFDCLDNMTLLSERSLLAHNLTCDSNINNIHTTQNSVFYMKDDIFAQNSNMIGVLRDFAKQDVDIMNQLIHFTLIESLFDKIESPILIDDVIAVMQLFTELYITKEMVVSLYEDLKSDYNKAKELFDGGAFNAVMDNFINALDGIVYNNNNSISISMTLKDKDKVDDIISSEYIKCMIADPECYDINIVSSK